MSGKRAPPKGLKGFIEEFQGKQHRSIETRLMLFCSFAVFSQFMFYNPAEGKAVTYSTLSFASLCVLVTVFSTWLDYFPSRLSTVNMRPAQGQGLPLACLLLPTVANACLHQVLLHNPSFTGILYLYGSVLTQTSAAIVLGSLLFCLPYPSSFIFFNFSLAGVSFFFQWWMGTPMLLSLPALALFTVAVLCLLTTFPGSFTLAEAATLSQGLVIMIMDVSLQVLHLYGWYSVPLAYTRPIAVLYVELLLTGVGVCCVALSPVLYKVSSAKDHTSLKFWSGTFILLSLAVGFIFILPWLAALLHGNHPIPFLFIYLSSSTTRLCLVGYWLLVAIVTGVLVAAQSSSAGWAGPFKSSQPSSLWMRKCFHMSALCAFLPGLLLDVDFLSFAASMTTFLFVVAELMRVCGMWPWGEGLASLLGPLCDGRDKGPLIVTHLYLLLGFSLPLWVSPLTSGVGRLSLYSGVLSLGVGDSMAAVAGSLFGKLHWPGTLKTVEGSVMSLLTQLLTVAVVVVLDSDIPFPSSLEWLWISGGITLTTLLEAYTWQIDNLVLSLTLCALYTAFL